MVLKKFLIECVLCKIFTRNIILKKNSICKKKKTLNQNLGEIAGLCNPFPFGKYNFHVLLLHFNAKLSNQVTRSSIIRLFFFKIILRVNILHERKSFWNRTKLYPYKIFNVTRYLCSNLRTLIKQEQLCVSFYKKKILLYLKYKNHLTHILK